MQKDCNNVTKAHECYSQTNDRYFEVLLHLQCHKDNVDGGGYVGGCGVVDIRAHVEFLLAVVVGGGGGQLRLHSDMSLR